MKTLVLVKRHSCIQLGHLYEHLFMARLKEFFYEKGVYKSLDLATWGATYEQGGIIEVVCELYTEQAQSLIGEINQLHIDLSDESIARQLRAISAEESWKLFVTDKNEILDDLKQLDSATWAQADTIEYIDTRKIRRKNPPLYLTNVKAPRARKLHIQSTLDDKFAASHPELTPLFNVLSRWFLLTIADQIAISRGYFTGELTGRSSPVSVSSELKVAQYVEAAVDLSSDRHLVADILQTMTKTAMIEEYVKVLCNTSYKSNLYLAPDTERILTQTGVYVGGAGWQHIATAASIRDILSHTRLMLSYGQQKEYINP